MPRNDAVIHAIANRFRTGCDCEPVANRTGCEPLRTGCDANRFRTGCDCEPVAVANRTGCEPVANRCGCEPVAN
eukprot:8880483-Lingulodinium_polyedra.AAC.1